MVKLELSNNAGTFINEGLNFVGEVSEKSIKPILAATVLITALDLLRKKSPTNAFKIGLIMIGAVGTLKGVSIAADIGVDAISHPERSS